MSFLKERIPSIRSQLVPADVEFDFFHDRIIRFIFEMIQNEKLQNNQTLEIEVKLGAFFQRDDSNTSFQDTLYFCKMITAFNYAIINECQPNYMFAPCFTQFPWNCLYFDSTAYPPPFQHLLMYLVKLTKLKTHHFHERQVAALYVDPNNEQCLGPSVQTLRLDFIFASGERASVLLDNKGISCDTIIKQRLGDQDVMKGEHQFRITGQIETMLEQDKDGNTIKQRQQNSQISFRILNGEPVKQIRFKSTISIRFQFMRIDLSRVLHLKTEEILPSIGHVKWQTLLLSLQRSLHNVDDWEQIRLAPQHRAKKRVQDSKRKCEVEIEIEDLDFVRQYPEAAVKRLIRNVDSFFLIEKVHKDLLMLKVQEKHPKQHKNDWQPPLIGSYQYAMYQKNHKLQHLPEKQ